GHSRPDPERQIEGHRRGRLHASLPSFRCSGRVYIQQLGRISRFWIENGGASAKSLSRLTKSAGTRSIDHLHFLGGEQRKERARSGAISDSGADPVSVPRGNQVW